MGAPRELDYFASGKRVRQMAHELRRASFEIRAQSQALRQDSARLRNTLDQIRDQLEIAQGTSWFADFGSLGW